VRDIGKLDRSLDDVTTSGKKAGGKSGIGKLMGTLAVGVPVVGAVVAGMWQLGESLIDAGQAAYEDNKEAKKLEQTLRKIPGVTDKMVIANGKWIDGMELATNVSDTELRAAMSKLALATGDVTKAQEAVTVAVDASTASGTSLTTVATAMAKAANGNTAALQKLYPWLKSGKDGTLTYAEAMEQLGEKFGGAAAEAAKNDPYKTLQTIFGQLKEAVGSVLLPVLEKFSDWFAKPKNQEQVRQFITRIGDMATTIGTKLLPKLEAFLTWLESGKWRVALTKFNVWLVTTKNNFMAIYNAVSAVIRIIGNLISAIGRIPGGLGAIGEFVAGSSGGGGGAGGGDFRGAPTATATSTTTSAPPPPTVIVTEEQIYRAVTRLLMKGQARNGRMVMVG